MVIHPDSLLVNRNHFFCELFAIEFLFYRFSPNTAHLLKNSTIGQDLGQFGCQRNGGCSDDKERLRPLLL